MKHDVEQRIRDRAYHMWEAAGRPHGRDQEFWEQATAAEHAPAAPAPEARPAKGKRAAAAEAEPAPKPARKPAAAKTEEPAAKPKRGTRKG